MNVNRLNGAVLAALVIAAGVASALADEQAVNRQIDELLGDHVPYQAVIAALQKAVAAHDAAGVAALVAYPITVKVDGKKRRIGSAKDFAAHYAGVMTPNIAKAVVDQKYQDLFVRDQGVMFGDGQVWISGVCRDKACKTSDVKVITIQE